MQEKFDIDNFEDVGTGEYAVKHPSTGRETSLILTLAGPEYPKRKKAQFARIRQLRNKAAKTGKIDLDDPQDEDENTTMEIAGYILGWKGLVVAGNDVQFTPEEAIKLMRDPKRRWLRDQVKVALDERELFIKTCDGE